MTIATVEISELKIFAHHGVYPDEKINGQFFQVDALVRYDAHMACMSDQVEHAVDYTLICDLIEQEMKTPSALLEHVVFRTIQTLKIRIPQLLYIRIKLTKLKPPIASNLSGISVTLEEEI